MHSNALAYVTRSRAVRNRTLLREQKFQQMMLRNLLLLLFLCVASCSPGSITSHSSSLEVHSMAQDRSVLTPRCTTVVCTEGFANEGDVWMTDIPLEQLTSGTFTSGQIIHLQVLWTPVAGKTPLVPTSTNLAIEYIIVSNGEVGVYGGGGFGWLSGTPETGMHVKIEDATVAIEAQANGFTDLLTPATIVGTVNSVPDSTIARQIATAAELLR